MLHTSRSPGCGVASARDAALQSRCSPSGTSLIFRSDAQRWAVVLSAAKALNSCLWDGQDAVQLRLEGLVFFAC